MKNFFIYFLSITFIGQIQSIDLPIIEYQSINHPIIGDEGMVVSQRMIASKVGASILRRGGNAVDAAAVMRNSLLLSTICFGFGLLSYN